MNIRFKVQANVLNEALETASIVSPKPLTPNKDETKGFLFVVRGGQCFIYSRDAAQVVRVDLPASDVEGEGEFIYPAAASAAFKFIGDEIVIEAVHENGAHTVRYSALSGATAERSSFDPGLVSACDKELEAAGEGKTFPVAVLREALGLARPFLADPKDNRVEEQCKTIQVFDKTNPDTAKGNGHLYVSNNTQAFYFFCEAFLDKGLSVHGKNLGVLSSFLSKCEGDVTIQRGERMTFLTSSKGWVLGWAHLNKTYTRYSYYPPKADTIILSVPVSTILTSLSHISTEMPNKQALDRIKVNFEHGQDGKGTLQFQVSSGDSKAVSFPILVVEQTNIQGTSFSFGVSLKQFRSLFEGVKGHEIDLRVAVMSASETRPKEAAMFRTIDDFWLDDAGKALAGGGADKTQIPKGAVQCLVTRLTPSMN